MDKETEYRWCKFCMARAQQELVYLPEMATYKRRRQYRCTICNKTSWLQGRRPSAESVY